MARRRSAVLRLAGVLAVAATAASLLALQRTWAQRRAELEVLAAFLGTEAAKMKVTADRRLDVKSDQEGLVRLRAEYPDPAAAGQRARVDIALAPGRGYVRRALWLEEAPAAGALQGAQSQQLAGKAESFVEAHAPLVGAKRRLAEVKPFPANEGRYVVYSWELTMPGDPAPAGRVHLTLRSADGRPAAYGFTPLDPSYLARARITRDRALEIARGRLRLGPDDQAELHDVRLAQRSPYTAPGTPVWTVVFVVTERRGGRKGVPYPADFMVDATNGEVVWDYCRSAAASR